MTKKILFVDDHGEWAYRVYSHILRDVGVIMLLEDGISAYEYLKESEIPDLLIVDGNLPGMSGFDLVLMVRRNRRLKNIPILFLTAYTGIAEKAEAEAAGVDAYLTKPVGARELKDTVTDLLLLKPTSLSWNVAMMGAKGGVGVTTAAINIGVALAKKGKKTVLFDCRPSGGTLTHQLRLKAETDFSTLLSKHPDRIRDLEIESCFVKHSSGLFLLMSPKNQVRELTVEHVQTILSSLDNRMDFIVIDLPPVDTPFVRRTLELSNQVLLFTEPDTLSVRCISQRISKLKDWDTFDRSNIVVANRTPLTTKLNHVEVEIQAGVNDIILNEEPSRLAGEFDVTQHSTRGVVNIIPASPEILYAADGDRVPIVLTDPNSRPAQAMLNLAEWILDNTKKVDTRQVETSY